MLLAGVISHTSIQYMDFVEVFSVSLDLSTIHLFVLVGAKLPFCLVVTLYLGLFNIRMVTYHFNRYLLGLVSMC